MYMCVCSVCVCVCVCVEGEKAFNQLNYTQLYRQLESPFFPRTWYSTIMKITSLATHMTKGMVKKQSSHSGDIDIDLSIYTHYSIFQLECVLGRTNSRFIPPQVIVVLQTAFDLPTFHYKCTGKCVSTQGFNVSTCLLKGSGRLVV